MISTQSVWEDVQKIRTAAPLIHNITNYVVMNNTANALLAIGASPVMAHAPQEVAAMVNFAGSLVINIGTLSDAWIDSMEIAMKAAADTNTPIVFDPVGAGATPLRTDTVKRLFTAASPTIIRGNGSEIQACVTEGVKTKGVDSLASADSALGAAQALHDTYDCTIVVSGATDYIVGSSETVGIQNGDALMTKVTGLGCTATVLCGAFAAVNPNFQQAAAHAMAVMGIAGEMAAEKADGPGTLQLHFLDALYNIDEDALGRLKLI